MKFYVQSALYYLTGAVSVASVAGCGTIAVLVAVYLAGGVPR